MDGVTIQRIREALLDRRTKIYGAAAREAEQPSQPDNPPVEIIDIAQALEQIDRDKSLAEQERQELRSIERALAKMAAGDFGICEDCGLEIPEKRLLVLPHARLCTKCQMLEEKVQTRSRLAG